MTKPTTLPALLTLSFAVLALCGLTSGCAADPEAEETTELGNQPLEVTYSLRQVLCNDAGDPRYVIKNRTVDLQIDNTVPADLVEMHLKGFEFWGIRVNSIVFSNPDDAHDPSRYGLAICDLPEWETPALFLGGGTGLNYVQRYSEFSESVRQTFFTHEIGHCVGLPDNTSDFSLMNGPAAFRGAVDITPAERAKADELLEGKL